MTPAARAIMALTLAGVLVAACCGIAADGRAPTVYKPSGATFTPIVVSTPTPAPTPPPRPVAGPLTTPKPSSKPRGAISTALIGGKATWYCCTKGYGENQMVAAAGSELRIGNWRGRIVTVTGPGGNSIRVKLIDWCGCKGSRIIDLHPAAFRRLAPLSRGVIDVTVTIP